MQESLLLAERIEGTVSARQPEALLEVQPRVVGRSRSVLGQCTHEVVIANGGVVFALDRAVHNHVGIPARRDFLGRRVEAIRNQIATTQDQVRLLGVDGIGGHHKGGGRLPFRAGMDVAIEDYSQAALNKVARQLNERPRKTLEYETPAERFNACVALTN